MEHDLRYQIEELEQRLTQKEPQKAELLEKAYEEIASYGLAENVPKAGDEAPDFTLPNAVGIPIALSAALAHGPTVVTFYRGIW